jgi:F0F1-type ATP synthase epsilon subunit
MQDNNEVRKEKSLKVFIRNKTQDLYKGLAYSVSSSNEKGEFDVCPSHANFVTLAKKEIIIDKGFPTEYKIPIETGMLYVNSNKVDVYLGLA